MVWTGGYIPAPGGPGTGTHVLEYQGCGIAIVDGKPVYYANKDLRYIAAVDDFVFAAGSYVEVEPGTGEYGFNPEWGVFVPVEWGIPGIIGTHNWIPVCTMYPKNTYIHQWDKLCSGTHPAHE